MAKNIQEEFVSKEEKRFSFKIGRTLASALAGFVAGFIVAAIVLVPYLIWLGKLLNTSNGVTK